MYGTQYPYLKTSLGALCFTLPLKTSKQGKILKGQSRKILKYYDSTYSYSYEVLKT